MEDKVISSSTLTRSTAAPTKALNASCENQLLAVMQIDRSALLLPHLHYKLCKEIYQSINKVTVIFLVCHQYNLESLSVYLSAIKKVTFVVHLSYLFLNSFNRGAVLSCVLR